MLGELKQFKILRSLKPWILHVCLWSRQTFCKILVTAPIRFEITENELKFWIHLKWTKSFEIAQNKLNMRKMIDRGVGTREGFRVFFFPTFLNKLLLILFLCFSHITPLLLSGYFWHSKNIFSLQCGCPMIQKQLNLVKKWEKYWKLIDDKHMFGNVI
jgi:hypothetical protein